MNEPTLLQLQGADGEAHRCRLLGVFEYESNEYALLLDLGEVDEEDHDEPEPVLMRVVHARGEAEFSTIEDDAEFARVSTYVKDLAKAIDEQDALERN